MSRTRSPAAAPTELGDPLRRLVLHVAVVPGGHRRRAVHRLERGDGLVRSEIVGESAKDPVRLAEAGRLVGPGHRQAGGDLAQHGVEQTLELGRGGLDGGPDRGVSRRGEEGELERPEPQPGPGRRVDAVGVGEEAVDEPVTGPTHAGDAVDQLGDEGPIASVEAAAIEQRGQQEVGVGALGRRCARARRRRGAGPRHPPGCRRRHSASRLGGRASPSPGGAHVPNRSPRAGRAPLRQSPSGWRAFPSGCTSSTSTAPSPAAHDESGSARPCPTDHGARSDLGGGAPRLGGLAESGRGDRTGGPHLEALALPRRVGPSETHQPVELDRRSSPSRCAYSLGSILAAWVTSPDWASATPRPSVSRFTSRSVPSSTRRPRSDVECVVGADLRLRAGVDTPPVSSPSATSIRHTPVRSSPASRARSTGAAPRHRGNSEKWMFTMGSRSRTARGMIRP